MSYEGFQWVTRVLGEFGGYDGYESLREFGGLQELSEFRGFSMGYESFRRIWRITMVK